LPQNIQKESEIKLLFERLRHPHLLSKCLHGKTQNLNEAFNNVVWTKCPKTVYVNRKTLEIGVASAVLEFNEGKDGILQVFKNVGLKIGQIQHQSTVRLGVKRKRHLDRKSSSPVKRRRLTESITLIKTKRQKVQPTKQENSMPESDLNETSTSPSITKRIFSTTLRGLIFASFASFFVNSRKLEIRYGSQTCLKT